MFFLFFILFLFISFFLMVFSFFVFNYGSFMLDLFFSSFGASDISFCFYFDYVSLLFFSVVSLISSVVFYYSKFYMGIGDSSNLMNNRFICILFLFVSSMFFLVFSFSWPLLMLGWDGLGMVSFLLVIFYNNYSSLNSGLITVFTNRLGDCLFILSFVGMYICGSFYIGFIGLFPMVLLCLFILIGSITKSAQAPFSSWLPAAMAAPTPVSSLVHSSTLVTAGVYLIYRFSFLLESCMWLLSVVSIFTMMIAGVCSMVELDFKKIVAMSTLSQLGFMLFSLSFGMGLFCFLHMMFHAFFKSMLFLSTGGFMHLLSGDQDSRFFGSFSDSFFTKCFFNCSCMSLMGMPFTLGFYSKDFIISNIFFNNHSILSFFFFLCCCFTVSYSIRMISSSSFYFPTFSTSFTFGESSSFYFPVFLLFFSCLFFGNFFMMNFFPIVLFSFFDLFLGFLAIIFGFFMYIFFASSYFMIFYLSFIGFLSIILGGCFSPNMCLISYSQDLTWVEMFGAKGLDKFIFSISKISNSFMYISFWSMIFFYFFITLLM